MDKVIIIDAAMILYCDTDTCSTMEWSYQELDNILLCASVEYACAVVVCMNLHEL